jgi:hypothetical protein
VVGPSCPYDRVYELLAGTEKFLTSFKEFPPRQRASSFTIDQAMGKLKQSLGDG